MRNYYSMGALLGCLILWVLLIRVKEIGDNSETQKRYKVLIIAAMVLALVDTLWGYTYLNQSQFIRSTFIVFAYLYMAVTAAVNYTWLRFTVAQMEFRPTALKVRRYGRIALIVQLIILITNPIHHQVFTIHLAGFDKVGVLRDVMFAMQAAGAFFMCMACVYYYISSPFASRRKMNAKYGIVNSALQFLTVWLGWSKSDSPMYSWGCLISCIFIYILDITQIIFIQNKELEKQKREIQEDRNAIMEVYDTARKTSDSKGEFLTKMAHDMVNPVNSIMSLCTIVSSEANNTNLILDSMPRIRLNAERIMKNVNEVLYMNKVEVDKTSLNLEEMDFSDVFKEIKESAHTIADETGNKFEVVVHDIRHQKVMGDREKTRSCVIALISNALKYTPSGGQVTMTVTEVPTTRERFAQFICVVEDNGIGMDEECQEHMFDPFYRSRDPRVQQIKGSGLGLSIVSNIINMINGKIEVESEIDRGTKVKVTVYFELPEKEDHEVIDINNNMTLIIDGDIAACGSVTYVLEEIGVKCRYFLSSQGAIRHLKKLQKSRGSYGVVILDKNTVAAGVYFVIKSIKELIGDEVTILLAVTGDCDITDDNKPEGVDGIIRKPCYKSRIEEAYRKYVK